MVERTGATILAHRNAKDAIPGMTRGLARGRRDQGREDRRARGDGYAGPHDVPRVPALAHRSDPRCSAAIRSSTPAPGTATTAAIPPSSTRRFPSSSRGCPRRRRSIRATTTSRTTCASRSTASPTTRTRRTCSTASTVTIPRQRAGHHARRRARDQHVLPSDGARPSSRGCARRFPTCPTSPTQRTVFLKLRELRNKW